MPFHDTAFEGVKIFEPRLYKDRRGYFYESYNERLFRQAGIETSFVQDNQAFSTYGVLRGLHYQKAPKAQAKLVRVILGEVLDLIVDLRPEQPTYGQWFSLRLSDKNHKQLFVPRGFAHGYLALSPQVIFAYKCDNYYDPDYEAGIRFDDPSLNIDWGVPKEQLIISEKDKALPFFEEIKESFL